METHRMCRFVSNRWSSIINVEFPKTSATVCTKREGELVGSSRRNAVRKLLVRERWFTISRFYKPYIEQSRAVIVRSLRGSCILFTFFASRRRDRPTGDAYRHENRVETSDEKKEGKRERGEERERGRGKKRLAREEKGTSRSPGQETDNLSGFFSVTSLRDSAAFRVLSCLHPCNDIHRAMQRISRIDLALWLLLRYGLPRLRPSFVCNAHAYVCTNMWTVGYSRLCACTLDSDFISVLSGLSEYYAGLFGENYSNDGIRSFFSKKLNFNYALAALL